MYLGNVLNEQLSDFDRVSNCLSWDEISRLGQEAEDYGN